MRYTVRPISDRTPFTGRHEYTPFRATWSDTLDLLDRELSHLAATNVVLEVDVANEGQIRLDGMLRAGAKVTSPAVRLAFDSKHGPLTYATDRYVGRYSGRPADWQENVRAIALALEALRRVDRYGVTKRGEQYAGWKQLPSGSGVAATQMTTADALDFLYGLAPEHRRHNANNADLVRMARAATHPDRNGGDRSLWDRVEQAARVLGVLT